MKRLRQHLTARNGWITILTLVLAYEAVAPKGELLSEGADRGIAKHPVVVRAIFLVTAAHLANLIPREVDPFTQAHTMVGLALGGIWSDR